MSGIDDNPTTQIDAERRHVRLPLTDALHTIMDRVVELPGLGGLGAMSLDTVIRLSEGIEKHIVAAVNKVLGWDDDEKRS